MILATGNYEFMENYVNETCSTKYMIVYGVLNVLTGTPGFDIYARHRLKECLEGMAASESLHKYKNIITYRLERTWYGTFSWSVANYNNIHAMDELEFTVE